MGLLIWGCSFRYFPVLVKKNQNLQKFTGIDRIRKKNYQNSDGAMLPRLRASPRHGGAMNVLAHYSSVSHLSVTHFSVFLKIVIDPPRGALRGGGVYHIRGYGDLNPHLNSR